MANSNTGDDKHQKIEKKNKRNVVIGYPIHYLVASFTSSDYIFTTVVVYADSHKQQNRRGTRLYPFVIDILSKL